MKIALINPLVKAVPNFGLLSLASYLEAQGYEVQVFELFDLAPYPERQASRLSAFLEGGFALAGISCLSYDFPYVTRLIAWIKARDPQLPIVVGGKHPSVFPEPLLEAGADFACLGEGEIPLAGLARALEEGAAPPFDLPGLAGKQHGKAWGTPPDSRGIDLDRLPPPALHRIDYAAYTRLNTYGIKGQYRPTGWVFTSRGCSGRCLFCYHPLFHQHLRFRDLDLVMEEIRFQVRRYRLWGMMIFDDVFTVNERRVGEFCERLLREPYRLACCCEARVDTLTREMVRRMKRAGFVQIGFGLESGSQRILDHLKKEVRVSQMEEAIRLCRESGIRVAANMILGTPWEEREDLDRTKDFLRRNRLDMVGVTYLTPTPGTALYEEATRQGWFREPRPASFDHGAEEPPLKTRLPVEEIKRFRDELYDIALPDIIRSLLGNPRFLLILTGIVLRHPRRLGELLLRWRRGTRNELIKYLTRLLYLHHFRLDDGEER